MFSFFLKSCGHLNNIWNIREIKRESNYNSDIQPDTSGNQADEPPHEWAFTTSLTPSLALMSNLDPLQIYSTSMLKSPCSTYCARLTLFQPFSLPNGCQPNRITKISVVTQLIINILCSSCLNYNPHLAETTPCAFRTSVFRLCHSSIRVPIWQKISESKTEYN